MRISRSSLRPVLEIAQAGAIALSAVTLISLQFLRNSLPAPHLVLFPSELLIKAVIFFIVIPAFLLLVVDRVIDWRFSRRAVLAFRSALMLLSLVIGMRQLQLYWGPAETITVEIQDVAVVLFPISFVALAALLGFLIVRFHGVAVTFFTYFAPAALFLAVQMPFEEDQDRGRFDLYSGAEVERPAADSPPVYILVFDEFSYDALLSPDGTLNEAAYPNFARLATEGMNLTNATTHHFYTWLVIPELLDAVFSLADDYEVRLYEQAQRIEGYYAPACGSLVTCRGVRHLTLSNDGLAFELAARSLYAFLPDRLESMAQPLIYPLLRTTGVVPPPADPLGFHVVSPELLSQFISDINAETARGRISFMHSLLPHHPMPFDADGDITSDEFRRIPKLAPDNSNRELFDARWRQYRAQVGYVDAFIGDLLDRLESEGLLDEAIVIVTADHGQRIFFPHFESRPELVESISTNIPFFILAPGLTPGPNDEDYQHIDFGPTLYDLLGEDPEQAPIPDSARATGDARSFFADEKPPREKTFLVYDYWADPRFWRYRLDRASGEWKLFDDITWLEGDRTLKSIQLGDPDQPIDPN